MLSGCGLNGGTGTTRTNANSLDLGMRVHNAQIIDKEHAVEGLDKYHNLIGRGVVSATSSLDPEETYSNPACNEDGEPEIVGGVRPLHGAGQLLMPKMTPFVAQSPVREALSRRLPSKTASAVRTLWLGEAFEATLACKTCTNKSRLSWAAHLGIRITADSGDGHC
jgi:hypothetical protein